MPRRGDSGGFSFVSLVISLLIGFALLAVYLREVTPGGPKAGVPGVALDAARKQAQNFETEQRKRIEQMDQIGH